MKALLLTLSLLLGPLTGYAQETGVATQPVMPTTENLNLPPSPPDPSIPSAPQDMPIGAVQPNPDFNSEVEQRNETERREEDARRNAAAGGSSASTPAHPSSSLKKLKYAKMEQGPAIAPEVWKKGRWYHGKHDGSFAWWWVTDNVWFRYDKASYPYPDHTKRQVFIPNAGSATLSSVAPGHK